MMNSNNVTISTNSFIDAIQHAKANSNLLSCGYRGNFPDSAIAEEESASYRELLSDSKQMTELDTDSIVGIIKAMGEYGGEEDVPALKAQLSAEQVPDINWAVVTALRSIGGLAGMKALHEIANVENLDQSLAGFALTSAAETRSDGKFDGEFGPWQFVDQNRGLFRTSILPYQSFNTWDQFRSELLTGKDPETTQRLTEFFSELDAS